MSQSIARALEILRIIAKGTQNPSDIARHLDVHRSTALRIMESLVSDNFLRKQEDGHYALGSELLLLAQSAQEQLELTKMAHPRLLELSKKHDKTIHLAEKQGKRIVYIDKIEPQRAIRLTSRIGQTVSLHTASVAKAILAFMPDKMREEMLSKHHFEAHTPTTILSREILDRELTLIKERGWAHDNGELEDYINSIGVPIRNATGEVIAAVSVIELKVISDLNALQKEVLEPLQETAREISKEIGWRE